MRGGGGAQTPGTGLRRGAEGVTSLYRAYRGKGEPPDYTQAEVIVLDDLGKVRPSEHSYQTLMTLIEHVISEGKTLIVTSNYSPFQAARRCALEEPQAAFPLAPGKIIEVGGYDHRAARPQRAGFVGQKNWAKSFGGGPRGVPWGEGKPLPRAGKPGAFLPPVRGSGRRKEGKTSPSRDSRRDLPK